MNQKANLILNFRIEGEQGKRRRNLTGSS